MNEFNRDDALIGEKELVARSGSRLPRGEARYGQINHRRQKNFCRVEPPEHYGLPFEAELHPTIAGLTLE